MDLDILALTCSVCGLLSIIIPKFVYFGYVINSRFIYSHFSANVLSAIFKYIYFVLQRWRDSLFITYKVTYMPDINGRRNWRE